MHDVLGVLSVVGVLVRESVEPRPVRVVQCRERGTITAANTFGPGGAVASLTCGARRCASPRSRRA